MSEPQELTQKIKTLFDVMTFFILDQIPCIVITHRSDLA